MGTIIGTLVLTLLITITLVIFLVLHIRRKRELTNITSTPSQKDSLSNSIVLIDISPNTSEQLSCGRRDVLNASFRGMMSYFKIIMILTI